MFQNGVHYHKQHPSLNGGLLKSHVCVQVFLAMFCKRNDVSVSFSFYLRILRAEEQIIDLVVWDDDGEDWHLWADGRREGALLEGQHLLGLGAVVSGALGEDDHVSLLFFGLQLSNGQLLD